LNIGFLNHNSIHLNRLFQLQQVPWDREEQSNYSDLMRLSRKNIFFGFIWNKPEKWLKLKDKLGILFHLKE